MQIILWVIIDVLMSILDMLVTICVNLKVNLTSRYSTENLRCILHTKKKKQKSQRNKVQIKKKHEQLFSDLTSYVKNSGAQTKESNITLAKDILVILSVASIDAPDPGLDQ